MTSSVSINGLTIVGGRSISINNGKVVVDGKDVTPDGKVINITVSGDVEVLSVDSAEKVEVAGSCGSVKTMSGNVSCRNIDGPVKTMSGNVVCDAITGNVSTMSGNVIHK